MAAIPRSKPRATREEVIQGLISSGLWSNDKVSKLSVAGVRGYYDASMGLPGNDRGIWDDAVFLIGPDTFESFNFNTDPSSYRKGMATLESPQRVVYTPGYHGFGRSSGHPAFRQSSDVVVLRDRGVGNGTKLGKGRFTDEGASRFWINLHRGGRITTSSAGCQTVPPSQWKDFYALVRSELGKYGQSSFSYFLFDGPIT
jgi:lysozyme|tara:strand:- start:4975 stop:5574 length:600 start_codon:yes stop_codon:yes gene_type:complete